MSSPLLLKKTGFTSGNRWKGLMDYGCAVSSFLTRIKIFFYQPFFEAMRFGDLPSWATDLSRLIQKAVCFSEKDPDNDLELDCEEQQIDESGPLPFNLLWREPLFDQLITNVYQPGEGICAHVDLMRFEDGIAIVSMESECVMHFSRADQETHLHEAEAGEEGSLVRIPVLLNPGSLVLMHGEARYSWKHEINRKAGFQTWKGREIVQKRRTSVTLRKLCLHSEG
ncbi:alkylated DNA repair protein alkB homolog 8 isoform X3 [Phalaenopsis equestris]|uniref:alkylated DNA repair protein alkB homolog 8 isoform X3 n=1 Tax=Phalaenopsis equestris TaxID=78828 RepID=UPI0009E5CA29|nr:alkylated DNA repair protein alkB homolog 8 isoform X3 [Phalaenopsis equestris]